MTRMTWLYDFYGNLLTDKQKQYMELYYSHDLSLGEISEEQQVSRQAVHDNLKRAQKALENYEDKLGLVAKFMQERAKLNKIVVLLEDFEKTGAIQPVGEATGMIKEILELENN